MNNGRCHLVLYSMLVGVILNLILPAIVMPFATEKQIKPPNGAANLSFFDQLMHMLVHHAQVPLTSSIIVAVIVGISTLCAVSLVKKLK
jgi:hypothetical protein